MLNIHVPEVTFNQNRLDKYFDMTKVGTLDVLGATLEDTFYYNPTNALDRMVQMQLGKGNTGNIMTPDEYKESEYFRDGLESPEEGIKEGYAQLLAENYDKRKAIQQTLARSKGGFTLGAAQFGTMLFGSVLDPLNVASAFIPVLPAARYAHLVKQFGVTKARAMKGVLEGSVGATVVEPIVLGQASLEQDENYNLLDSFLNVTIGGALGGGLHVGFGRISDIIERRSAKAKTEATVTAIKQLVTDQEVEVRPILKADIEANVKKNLETEDKLSKPKTLEQVTKTGKRQIPLSLDPPKPKTILQFIKENGRINPKDNLASDLAQSLGASIKNGKFDMSLKATKGIFKKDGLSLDDMATRAQEAGYFHNRLDPEDYGKDGATPNDLLELIDREQRGDIVFSANESEIATNYEHSIRKREELDSLGIDYEFRTESELDELIQIKAGLDQQEDVAFSEMLDTQSEITPEEFDRIKTLELEKDYNLGNLKEDYADMVEMNAGIDDTFDLSKRDAELDAEIKDLMDDAENRQAAEADGEELATFKQTIKAADDLIARSNESYETAVNTAKHCIIRNTK